MVEKALTSVGAFFISALLFTLNFLLRVFRRKDWPRAFFATHLMSGIRHPHTLLSQGFAHSFQLTLTSVPSTANELATATMAEYEELDHQTNTACSLDESTAVLERLLSDGYAV